MEVSHVAHPQSNPVEKKEWTCCETFLGDTSLAEVVHMVAIATILALGTVLTATGISIPGSMSIACIVGGAALFYMGFCLISSLDSYTPIEKEKAFKLLEQNGYSKSRFSSLLEDQRIQSYLEDPANSAQVFDLIKEISCWKESLQLLLQDPRIQKHLENPSNLKKLFQLFEKWEVNTTAILDLLQDSRIQKLLKAEGNPQFVFSLLMNRVNFVKFADLFQHEIIQSYLSQGVQMEWTFAILQKALQYPETMELLLGNKKIQESISQEEGLLRAELLTLGVDSFHHGQDKVFVRDGLARLLQNPDFQKAANQKVLEWTPLQRAICYGELSLVRLFLASQEVVDHLQEHAGKCVDVVDFARNCFDSLRRQATEKMEPIGLEEWKKQEAILELLNHCSSSHSTIK
jgi:hypothetical protein